jgi:hypothetical protein
LQLALEDKGASGKTLGPLLASARSKKLLPPRADSLAEGIKDYVDGGAHRREVFEPRAVAMVIHITVMALNELFP